MVGRINGKFGSVSYLPIQYCKQFLRCVFQSSPMALLVDIVPIQNRRAHDNRFEQIVGLYSLADVVVVSSLREGISSAALEFVACQQEQRRGVLIYSEFAGCADSFKGALIVNPYDTDKLAEAMHVALSMGETPKQVRHHQLSRYVGTYTSAKWAKSMLSSLQHAVESVSVVFATFGDRCESTADDIRFPACQAREYNNLRRLDLGQLRAFYERGKRRLFVLDYDGTIIHHKVRPATCFGSGTSFISHTQPHRLCLSAAVVASDGSAVPRAPGSADQLGE
jgi:hypothetical protein